MIATFEELTETAIEDHPRMVEIEGRVLEVIDLNTLLSES